MKFVKQAQQIFLITFIGAISLSAKASVPMCFKNSQPKAEYILMFPDSISMSQRADIKTRLMAQSVQVIRENSVGSLAIITAATNEEKASRIQFLQSLIDEGALEAAECNQRVSF